MRRVCLLLGVALTAGCGDGSGPPVELVVPTGYTGPLRVSLDPNAPAIPLVDGRYRVVFPPDGVLPARSHAPFHRWHAVSALYADGTPIPVEHGHDGDLRPEVPRLRSGGSSVMTVNGREYRDIRYCVGTAEQCKDYP